MTGIGARPDLIHYDKLIIDILQRSVKIMPSNITGLTFDLSSKRALDEIRRKKKLFKLLKGSMLGGTIVNIFLGNKSYEIAVNIYLTDFEKLGQALRGTDFLRDETLLLIIQMQILEHTGKEQLFWEGLEDTLTR